MTTATDTLLSPVEVRIEGRPPTPNARRHWRQVARDNEYWHNVAQWACTEQVRRFFRKTIRHCDLEIIFVVPDRRHRDMDNLVASTKPLTDGLVRARLLADDSTEVIRRVTYSEQYEKGHSATIYRITEIAS